MDSGAAMTGGDVTAFASLSITHVQYDPNDLLSLVCAYLCLIPIGLMVAYVVLIWAHRELEVILMLAGQLGCEAVNYTLKHLIKESRPSQMGTKGYGMPSSHSQFMFFFSVYLSLCVSIRIKYDFKMIYRLLSVVALLSLAASVAASRVYLWYHTEKQVAVGATVGTLIAVLYFTATYLLRVMMGGFFWNMLLDNPLSNLLYIKDICRDVMVQEKEYLAWQETRKKGREMNGVKKNE